MAFRTELKLKPLDFSISHSDELFFLGSCFAENIGQYFESYKFKSNINPLGIIYHPIGLKKLVDVALCENFKPHKRAFYNNGLWSHFDAHSRLSRPDKNDFFDTLQQAKIIAKYNIENANIIFITLGTAWVYRHLESNQIVANCHKLPQKHFEKQLLSLEETQKALSDTINQIMEINPDVNIVFTLSPVRHLKDGFVNNQMSKSILHLAIQNTTYNFDQAVYFPSYELLLDDLREYRFYNNDMLHPSDLALDYIWSKLSDVFFSDLTKSTLLQIDKINKRLNHRFYSPNVEASQKFKLKTQKLIEELETKTLLKMF